MTAMSASIFLSYRREDTGAEAMLIARSLRQQFGENSCFMDTSSLQPGSVWPDELQSRVKAAGTVLVIIGPNWLRAGTNEWGKRRIDQKDDWVRQEIALALKEEKKLIPVVVNGASVPPAEVLPRPIKPLSKRQGIEIRRDYWDNEIKLLLAGLAHDAGHYVAPNSELGPYPIKFPEGPDPISEEKLQRMLSADLELWDRVESLLPEKPETVRVELFREFRFKSFQDAIRFMSQVAPGCDIAQHHPRWENIWKTIRVYLTTWDIGHRISDRDVQLARYFDRAYSQFSGAQKGTEAARAAAAVPPGG